MKAIFLKLKKKTAVNSREMWEQKSHFVAFGFTGSFQLSSNLK